MDKQPDTIPPAVKTIAVMACKEMKNGIVGIDKAGVGATPYREQDSAIGIVVAYTAECINGAPKNIKPLPSKPAKSL